MKREIPPHLEDAWRRARRRSIATDYGIDPESEEAVGAEFVTRPHELEPYEVTGLLAWGRKMAKEHGW